MDGDHFFFAQRQRTFQAKSFPKERLYCIAKSPFPGRIVRCRVRQQYPPGQAFLRVVLPCTLLAALAEAGNIATIQVIRSAMASTENHTFLRQIFNRAVRVCANRIERPNLAFLGQDQQTGFFIEIERRRPTAFCVKFQLVESIGCHRFLRTAGRREPGTKKTGYGI